MAKTYIDGVNVDNFVRGYLTAAVWSSLDYAAPVDTSGNSPNLDARTSVEDFTAEAVAAAIEDCTEFRQRVEALGLTDRMLAVESVGGAEFTAGHNLWLTRNHHGVGFWDGDYVDDAGEFGDDLTNAAQELPELNVWATTPEGPAKLYFEFG